MRFVDLSGRRFGMLVASSVVTTHDKRKMYNCVCDCGNTVVVRGTSLTTGNTLSCGCARACDLTGEKFGRLTVVRRDGSMLGSAAWLCKCECGNVITVRANVLKDGRTVSCGCYAKEIASTIAKKYAEKRIVNGEYVGGSESRIHHIWRGMIYRCSNENAHEYKYYGARGVAVCAEWLDSFDAFKRWAMCNGYSDNLSIDRINCDGNYSPDNCRWATAKEQANNRHKHGYLLEGGDKDDE